MRFELRRAERKRAKLKIGITSPSGGGKTYSSLQLAAGLTGGDWEKICIIDTEKSAELYADSEKFGPYNVISLESYDADHYIGAIDAAIKAGMEVVIIDSMTHFWAWVLDYHNELGGKFQQWAKANKPYQDVITKILQAPIHIICTTRRKTEYEISQENGRGKVNKVGLKQEFRDSFEYELSLVLALNQNHMASVEKDRTELFDGKPDFIITQETGEKLLKWNNSGAIVYYDSTRIDHKRLFKEILESLGQFPSVEDMKEASDKASNEKTDIMQLKSFIAKYFEVPQE